MDDFETDVVDTVDLVDAEYNITRKLTPVNIPHMDGCGIMLDKPTRMVRAPWVKGLLVYFPYDKFIEEYCGGECVVKDIYGQEHKIIEEGIKYIFTKSQFKLYKYYSSWDEYKENFKKHHCEICYCNMEEEKIPPAKINYQMLQTLTDMTDDEIDKITRSTIKDINNIGGDYRTNMRLLGADEYNVNKNYFQQALEIYPELFRDVYHREILKQTKASYIKQGKAGRLRVNGGYRFLSPDLYAFCEWLFLHDNNPKGLLENGEVFCEGFRDGSELACLRSPHLYREWAIRKNKKNDELKKWFDTKCIYTSCLDTISKILQFDNDGDKALVIKDQTLTACAKRNMTDIVTLAYDLKKAKAETLCPDNLYKGMTAAYTGGNIGVVSNKITTVWNADVVDQSAVDSVKRLCYINNQVIKQSVTRYSDVS